MSFDEYHGESMYHKQSLDVIEQFKSRGLLQTDRLVSRLLLSRFITLSSQRTTIIKVLGKF